VIGGFSLLITSEEITKYSHLLYYSLPALKSHRGLYKMNRKPTCHHSSPVTSVILVKCRT